MRLFTITLSVAAILFLSGCERMNDSAAAKQAQEVNSQQEQYAIAQPVPKYDYSIERDMLIQLYNIRNLRVVTHSVWRSDLGTIEGDCPSIGFGIPYDTSLTNPLAATHEDSKGYGGGAGALTTIEQPEPNGIYASKNTAATWVLCAGDNGEIEPIYIETKVTAYPYPVKVDYDTNRVTKAGKATVTIKNG